MEETKICSEEIFKICILSLELREHKIEMVKIEDIKTGFILPNITEIFHSTVIIHWQIEDKLD